VIGQTSRKSGGFLQGLALRMVASTESKKRFKRRSFFKAVLLEHTPPPRMPRKARRERKVPALLLGLLFPSAPIIITMEVSVATARTRCTGCAIIIPLTIRVSCSRNVRGANRASRGCQASGDSEIQRGTRSAGLSAPNSRHSPFKRSCAPRHSKSAILSWSGTSRRRVAKRRYRRTSS
jgi:hypothetical protein